jgi:hypothetical protein
MKKRKHHYVFQSYLSSWEVNDKVWCLRSGRVFNSSTENVAQQRDFYKLQELMDLDILMIEMIAIGPSPALLQPLYRNLLMIFQLPFVARRIIGEEKATDATTAALDEMIHNLEEDAHSQIESDGAVFLNDIKAGDLSFYKDDDKCHNFGYFVTFQYFRTKNLRERIESKLPKLEHREAVSRGWSLISHVFATNVAWTLFRDRRKYRIVLLDSDGAVPFIAGDQPVINTMGIESEELRLFYPVSPMRAILLTSDPAEYPGERHIVDAVTVANYNSMIFERSLEQVYSNSEVLLRGFVA